MRIELRRVAELLLHPLTNSQSGQLYKNGQYICDTEEYAPTALPAGEYRIVRHYCKQYDRFMPMIVAMGDVQRAKNCSQCPTSPLQGDESGAIYLNTTLPCYCPMLKPGNGVHGRTDGSILLGTRIIPGCLSHPLQAFEPLAECIRKAVSRGKAITLTITNSPTHQLTKSLTH